MIPNVTASTAFHDWLWLLLIETVSIKCTYVGQPLLWSRWLRLRNRKLRIRFFDTTTGRGLKPKRYNRQCLVNPCWTESTIHGHRILCWFHNRGPRAGHPTVHRLRFGLRVPRCSIRDNGSISTVVGCGIEGNRSWGRHNYILLYYRFCKIGNIIIILPFLQNR